MIYLQVITGFAQRCEMQHLINSQGTASEYEASEKYHLAR